MNHLTLSVLLVGSVFGQQAPAPPAPASGTAPGAVSRDTVVGTSAGRKITAGDVYDMVDALPPAMRENYKRDPKAFLSQWFFFQRLTKMAEEAKLAERSPYKEAIAISRMQVLSQAQIEQMTQNMVLTEDEERKYYETRKDQLTLAKLKLIYIPFVAPGAAGVGPDGGDKTLTEPEALSKAEKLVKELRAGADFVQAVKQHSEDPISKEKDGDFGPIRKEDQLPDAIKSAVFSLKPGETSDPIRQPNGYYIFRLLEFVPQPFEEVRMRIQTELRNARVKQWMEANAKEVELQVERPDFFEAARQGQN